MSDQIIPLTSSPNQTIETTLNVDGGTITLRLTFRFNEMAGYWIMTVQDTAGNMLVDSIPLITGEWPAANLLGQHSYLKIGSAYIINTGANTGIEYPDANTLGTQFQLLWSDTAA